MAAHTYTLVSNEVGGNERVAAYIVETSTTASGSVMTPVGYIVAAKISPLSAASGGTIIVRANKASDGSTTLNGSVCISNTTSGDLFYLVVCGKA